MTGKRTDHAVFERIAATFADVRRERPDLPGLTTGGFGSESILHLALNRLIDANTPYSTWESRWASMKRERPDLVPAYMVHAPPSPPLPSPRPPPPQPRTLAQDVVLDRARRDAKDAKDGLAEARARISELEDRVADLDRLRQMNPRPADWTLTTLGERGAHIPELLTSDFQLGEVIRAEETDGAHGYDVATFRRRYRTLIGEAISLCFEHAGGSWTYPGIIYERGGDTISGGIHEELAETDELTSIEAVVVAFEEEAGGILKLADAFGRVDVKSTPGNHDRNTHKPRSKKANAHSYDALVDYMLRQRFIDDTRVTFQGSKSPDIYFPVYERRLLLTHGDKIGSRGGMGMIGPAATIARGFQKVIQEQLVLGRPVDECRCGHFHTALVLEQGVSNGCLPGYSEYAKMNRLRPAPPSQWLMIHHPKWGVVDWKKIYLEEKA